MSDSWGGAVNETTENELQELNREMESGLQVFL